MTRIIAIGSGREGVGKTSLAINLAAQLAVRGQRVCLLDAGPAESGLCQTLDTPVLTTLNGLASVGGDERTLAQAHPGGFDLIALGLDESRAGETDTENSRLLAQALGRHEQYDYLLIDTACGIDQRLLAFILASPEFLLLVTTEAESLSDAYALLKVMYSEQYEGAIQVVVNKSKNHKVGRHSYEKFREVVDFYLGMQMPLSAIIDEDEALLEASQLPVLLNQLNRPSRALGDIDGLAQSLIDNPPQDGISGVGEYAQRYLNAAGVAGEDVDTDNEDTEDTHPDFDANDDLYRQLEFLSNQVDSLISEVERLRTEDERDPLSEVQPVSEAALFAFNSPAESVSPRRDSEPCSEACIAAMASDRETVTVQGESFPIFRIQKSNGDQQRFAFQTVDDDLEEPEPQSTLS